MVDTKSKITSFVRAYEDIFKEEFRNFLRSQQPKNLSIQQNNKFAEVKGSGLVERQLGEMPETLFFLLQKNLTAEEYQWYQSKKGQEWFYKTFKEYSVTGGIV